MVDLDKKIAFKSAELSNRQSFYRYHGLPLCHLDTQYGGSV